jgi:NADPH-dependent 7-cyano-7-deazaguanine reductase QueF
MTVRTVPCQPVVTVTTSAPLQHRCPFANETDKGTARITWTTAGETVELHALAEWLGSLAGEVISHEDITEAIRAELGELPGITDVGVRTEWTTAGARVEVIAGVVLREPVRRGGG